jgi:hypothetical protein
MKRSFVFGVLFSLYAFASAQVVMHKGAVPLHNEFNPSDLSSIQDGIYSIPIAKPWPSQVDPLVQYLANQKRYHLPTQSASTPAKRSLYMPQVLKGFSGALNEGTPNDNNMAVNDDSMVVSVLNTFIRVYTTSGAFKKNWSLEFFPKDPKNTKPGTGVGVLDRTYDPKIVFDPVAKRYILVYLEGSASSDTRIIISFSKTNNPLDGWNVYQINGNPFGGKYWTDYPMIAINGEDLFLTANILKDSTDWRDGFTQSLIWQFPKQSGFNADSLPYNLWSNIQFKGKSIWNICPVQDAFQPGKEGLYFLSVRPGDASNDTLFLHSINHNYSHGNPQYSYKILKSNLAYGLPPAAPQPRAGFRLQTNDARVLGAFYVNDKIQYVQTSMNHNNGRSSIYHGTVQYPDQTQPGLTAQLISYDSLDIAYPTIASAGNTVFGRQSMITFSHVGATTNPGTSVVYYDNAGQYSNLLMVKQGLGYINSFIVDSAERWGDYTSIQRSPIQPNRFWLSGSYGKSTNAVGTWLAEVAINDPSVGVTQIQQLPIQSAYPNPVADLITIPYRCSEAATLELQISNALGQVVYTTSAQVEAGQHKAFVHLNDWAPGMYYYVLKSNQVLVLDGSFSKQ